MIKVRWCYYCKAWRWFTKNKWGEYACKVCGHE